MGTEREPADRVALITGGTRGMGRATALHLAGEGYKIVVNYAANREAADGTVEEISGNGGQVVAVQADVADEDSVAALFDRAEAEFGGVDVVVQAAGVMPVEPLVEMDLANLDRVLRTNLRGVFVVAQQAARRIRPGGAMINFSSSIAKFARPGYSAYAASKSGVEAVSLILARELRGKDITVNAIAPGPIATELFLKGKSPELIQRMTDEIPLGRLGQPSDIVGMVSFLAGPGRWINGQVIYANGGAI
jgi:3-oxoacyl-[acyl-carrier protein] reductase